MPLTWRASCNATIRMDENTQQPADLSLPQTDGAWMDCKLGITNRKLKLETRDELRMISQHMAGQAQQSLHIFTRELDAELYDNEIFIEAVSRLARRSKYSFIHILTLNSDKAVKNGHQLIYLHQKLDSYIKIRRADEQHKGYIPAFMLTDKSGVVFRQFGDRHEAEANYKDSLLVAGLLKFFTEAWEISLPDPQLRRLHI
jgi:hypothetical protein